ncbi:MAG: phosphate acyltransferase PlsX [Calditrichaeota bacterium]|nr:MAG: phosphate acyltransferase PlsX [Calditrichota bacterium]MBL1205878.1 phosphate acyltransferase PlsX [Calditrichota bacterium]NOG45706.1 phosphate acyltransferase PlsX [Calditrichota bacterium]
MVNKIAIDAMGGDFAPQEVIKGVVQALNDEPDLNVVLIGDEKAIRRELAINNYDKELEIVHTEEFITMDDSPKKALESKPNASITMALKLLDAGKADALVSAGNTGATVLACVKNLHMIEGLERSALAAIYPTAKFTPDSKGFALMLDVGATIRCTAKQLSHFAFMGSYYVSEIMGVERPRIGLLNNGEEETKGGPVLSQTYKYLKNEKDLNFVGNVEGKEVPKGDVEIVVTEGFVGNVVLKLLEGVGEVAKDMGKYAFKKKLTWKIGLAFLAKGVKKVKAKTDYSEYGGAPILGFNKLVIKSHGRSNAKAIMNATKAALRSVEHDIVGHMTHSIQQFNEKHAIDFMDI